MPRLWSLVRSLGSSMDSHYRTTPLPPCYFGGLSCSNGSPTHFCDPCGLAWTETNCSPIVYELPKQCYFCGHVLSSKDQLVFSVAFEEAMDQNDSKLKLSDDTFKQAVYPVCGDCRFEIRENLNDLQSQDHQKSDNAEPPSGSQSAVSCSW